MSGARKEPESEATEPLLQPGKRPSSPGFLMLVAAAWILVGVVLLVTLHASWKLVPGVFAIGVGLLFLRGAMATVARRNR